MPTSRIHHHDPPRNTIPLAFYSFEFEKIVSHCPFLRVLDSTVSLWFPIKWRRAPVLMMGLTKSMKKQPRKSIHINTPESSKMPFGHKTVTRCGSQTGEFCFSCIACCSTVLSTGFHYFCGATQTSWKRDFDSGFVWFLWVRFGTRLDFVSHCFYAKVA
jgi:hypothetical protein